MSLTVGTASWADPFSGTKTFVDNEATNNGGTLNTAGGDYGILTGSDGVGGIVFYQAGVMVLTSSIWAGTTDFFSASTGIRTLTTNWFLALSLALPTLYATDYRIFSLTTQLRSTLLFTSAALHTTSLTTQVTRLT